MKILDLFVMSISNLWRRKLRTILTVLGVVIGTASIVVMLSLGFGLNKSTMEQIEESGSLTTITVYNASADEYFSDEDMEVSDEDIVLDDDAIASFQAIEHVEVASPMLNVPVILRQGAYEANVSLMGVSIAALESMKFELEEGELPVEGDTLKFLYGNQIITYFCQSSTGSGYWETGELPDIDYMDSPMFVIFDTDAYYNAQAGEEAMPKKYLIEASGVLAGGLEDYSESSYNVYCDLDVLVTQLNKIFKNEAIPGQPTTESGKPYSELQYDEAYIQVDKMDNVTDVQKQITELGFETYSNAEYLESMQKQYRSIQAVLGGIGAVSLFVAAIGIANTMMMSIYERTKEIGIIKVLGCSLGNIRTLFLLEAAFIGFIGGIFGVLLSYGISVVINHFLGDFYGYESATTISYIPLWLPVIALGFAILVGMMAGFFPALRAMKLSPLAAIRTE